MSEQHASVRELRQNLKLYLNYAEGGQPVVVTRDGKAIARLVPMSGAEPRRQAAGVSHEKQSAARSVSLAEVDEALSDLGERLGARIRRHSKPVGATWVGDEAKGTLRRLAERTARRVASDLGVPVPPVFWMTQESRNDDYEPLAGIAIPFLGAICLDRALGELSYDAKRDGDYGRCIRNIRHVVAHELYHLFDGNADESACDAFADGYSGGRSDVGRPAPACGSSLPQDRIPWERGARFDNAWELRHDGHW